MLSQIYIRNFAIIESLELDFNLGLTCITGETGAGKSILLDALGLCLGARAESQMLKNKQDKADILVQFNIHNNPQAQTWLQDKDIDHEGECIIRRLIYPEGRSKASINGYPVSLNQLKDLSDLLLQIHGQHAHHALLKAENQRIMLDQYAAHDALCSQVQTSFNTWKQAQHQLDALQERQATQQAEQELLNYQIEELISFAPLEDEYPTLEQEHKKHANGQQLLEHYQHYLAILRDQSEGNVQSMIARVQQGLSDLQDIEPQLTSICEMLNQASIYLDESTSELDMLFEQCDLNPEHLAHLESRLSRYHDLARKHQIQPEMLYQHFMDLQQKLDDFEQADTQLHVLKQEIVQYENQYHEHAQALHRSRTSAAKTLGEAVTQSMQKLNMPHAHFVIELDYQKEKKTVTGGDQVCYHLCTNMGQALQPVRKVASGGELSRIGLILQVLTSQKKAAPTLIFDEVDTGISGATAEVVGQLLRTLAKHTQTLCITHLPQVAGLGHHHILVEKCHEAGTTQTRLSTLSLEQRQRELARLLAGNTITESALENAKQLLCQAEET
tara:strand:- start:1440 stop:3113 length:1674 start_codon:yes stop_codon:yes gene_type:complete